MPNRVIAPGQAAYILVNDHGIGAKGVFVENDTADTVSVTVERVRDEWEVNPSDALARHDERWYHELGVKLGHQGYVNLDEILTAESEGWEPE